CHEPFVSCRSGLSAISDLLCLSDLPVLPVLLLLLCSNLQPVDLGTTRRQVRRTVLFCPSALPSPPRLSPFGSRRSSAMWWACIIVDDACSAAGSELLNEGSLQRAGLRNGNACSLCAS